MNSSPDPHSTGHDGTVPKHRPYDNGMLNAGDGHQVYWRLGNPALVLHSGPGPAVPQAGGSTLTPASIRIVLSIRAGAAEAHRLQVAQKSISPINTIAHLLADINLLRRQLNIDRWLVLGGSCDRP
jgi:proline iminopeptidase